MVPSCRYDRPECSQYFLQEKLPFFPMNQARITIQIQLRINDKLLLQQVAAERKDTKIADKLHQENVEIHESGTKI